MPYDPARVSLGFRPPQHNAIRNDCDNGAASGECKGLGTLVHHAAARRVGFMMNAVRELRAQRGWWPVLQPAIMKTRDIPLERLDLESTASGEQSLRLTHQSHGKRSRLRGSCGCAAKRDDCEPRRLAGQMRLVSEVTIWDIMFWIAFRTGCLA